MAVLASLTAPGGVVGDTFGSKRVEHVFTDTVYAWADDVGSASAAQEITADPAPAAEGSYIAAYAAAGPFTLPALASVDTGDKVTFTNVNGTAMTVTPAAGEILNGGVDNTFVSDSQRQRVVVEKVSATEWSVSPNFVDNGTLGYAEYTVAVAGVGVDWTLTEQTIRGSAVTTAGNTMVVASGRRVKFSFDASRAEVSGTEEFSYSFHDGTDHIGNSGTIMGHGVAATGASGVAVASVEGPAVVTIRATKLVGTASFVSNGATNATGAAMLTVEEYPPDTYQTGTLLAEPARDLIFDGASIGTATSQNLTALTWQQVKDTYDQVEVSVRFAGNLYGGVFDAFGLTDNGTFEFAFNSGTHLFVSSTALADGQFQVDYSGGGTATTFRIYGIRKQFNALRAEDAALSTDHVEVVVTSGATSPDTFTTQGIYKGNGTFSLSGAPVGNFVWSVDVDVFGSHIKQTFLPRDAGTTVLGHHVRRSFNGGAAWTAWAGH